DIRVIIPAHALADASQQTQKVINNPKEKEIQNVIPNTLDRSIHIRFACAHLAACVGEYVIHHD
ncbi:MAG: hypothetical protein ACF8OB_18565, partial [Phycisphaeraceae bacterium JB051]